MFGHAHLRLLSLVLAAVVVSPAAHAMWDRQQLQSSLGIAHPSLNQPFGSNPAGAVQIDTFKAAVSAGGPSGSGGGIGLGATLLFGKENASLGGGLGVTLPQSGQMGLHLGVAARLPSPKIAIGVSIGDPPGGIYGSTVGELPLNLGVLFNPSKGDADEPGDVRGGLTGYGLLGRGTRYLGAGVEWCIGRLFALTVDGLTTESFDGTIVHPALMVGRQKAVATLGAMMPLDAPTQGAIVTMGFSMELTPSTTWQFYFRQLNQYFMSFSIRL